MCIGTQTNLQLELKRLCRDNTDVLATTCIERKINSVKLVEGTIQSSVLVLLGLNYIQQQSFGLAISQFTMQPDTINWTSFSKLSIFLRATWGWSLSQHALGREEGLSISPVYHWG